ncbi:macrolide family glycosyltransferase [Bacillus sp. NPDC077027]|uniref:macrolide family glycosyltransferase n=1 Tax=Bacillus sp. NPDC077027 TaxID=3390548 RepID=UPI003CFDD822
MAKILLVNFPAEGHVNPVLGMTKAWSDRGDEVHAITTIHYQERFERLGAKVHLHPDYIRTLKVSEGHPETMQTFFYAHLQTTLDILAVVETLAKRHQFDVVYYDMFGAGELVRDYLNLPGIGSIPSFVLDEDHFGHHEPLFFLDEKTVHLLEELKNRFGVEPKHVMQFMQNQGELNIVYTSSYFQPDVKGLNDSYVFIGPSFPKRMNQHTFPIEALENERVIYISMGTVLDDTEAFFNLCIDAFSSFEGKVVIATGEKVDMSQIKTAPAHVLIYPYVPQLEVLEHTDVFITHGGMNSVNEAIHYHVPMVIIPHDKDQPMVAKRLTELSAAMALDKDQLTAKQLRESTSTVLSNDTYQVAIQQIEESFREAGGTKEALRLIDEYIQEKQPH